MVEGAGGGRAKGKEAARLIVIRRNQCSIETQRRSATSNTPEKRGSGKGGGQYSIQDENITNRRE